MFDILWIVLQWAAASLALSLALGHVFAVGGAGTEPPTTMRGARRPVRKMAPPEERMAAVVRPVAHVRLPQAGSSGLRPAAPPPRHARPVRPGR